ncbi:teichoic acids export ABC transporter ATP-binding subunit TagH [Rossellomorea sp. FM04394]|uniref:teichoic acids export ABC transporter ATP-binding subunit TagH n=1 Tax=Rossellomorea sp. FM04394 TaxID=3243076 RepID=UPI0035A68935
MKPKVKFKNVSKSYTFNKKQLHKLFDLFRIKKSSKNFFALQDVSFEVNDGESIGVIGINGSGKSTLSNLLAEVVQPSSGTIEMNGDPSLIAISAGLNNNLSGLENIELKCLMLGMDKREIKRVTPEIIEFADIGDFIEQPVKNYSSGMRSRLGFAISAHTNPDILIIDEALSVGDSTFYDKCLKKIEEFKKQGKTIFFISHSVGQVRSFSDRVMWIHFGKLKEFGEKKEVLDNYKEFISWFNDLNEEEKKVYRKEMLNEQFNRSNISRAGNHVKKESFIKRVLSSLTILLLTVLLSFFTLQMFDLKPFSSLTSMFKGNALLDPDAGDEKPEKIEEIPVGQNAVISTESVKVYEDKSLDNVSRTMEFGTEIYVDKKIGDLYSINENGVNSFIKADKVKLLYNPQEPLDISIREMLDFLPEIFTNSYSYYLAYLEMDYDKIKEDLLELTNERTDSYGRKLLEYSFDKITYRFNDELLSNAIIIEDIDTDSPELQDLIEKATVVDQTNGMYYLKTIDYKVTIDLQERKMALELIE